jgi:hypothetical protein
MIAFEIKINGKKVCIAGIRDFCDLAASLLWSCGPQVGPSTAFQHQDKLLRFQVSGARVRYRKKLTPNMRQAYTWTQSLDWVSREIRPGDEVTIKVIEASRVDKPRKTKKLP